MTALALRTRHLLRLPINAELAAGIAGVGLCLPGMIFGHRTEQVHGVLGLRGDEFTRIHVAAIHQMAGWQAVVRRQVFVDGRERVPIRQRRIRRLDVGDEPRQVGVAGFGEVRFVTAPFGLPLAAIARFDVIRRDDALSVRRHFTFRAPAPLRTFQTELLLPDQPQGGERRHFAQPGRGVGRATPRQHQRAIGSYLLR